MMETHREKYLQPHIRQCSDVMGIANVEKIFMY